MSKDLTKGDELPRINPPKVFHTIKEIVEGFSLDNNLTDKEVKETRYRLSDELFKITELGGFLDRLQRELVVRNAELEKAKANAYERALEEHGNSTTRADKIYRRDEEYQKALIWKDQVENDRNLVRDYIKQGNQILNAMSKINE